MSRLILCADDFALSRPISETIAALAADRRVNAISCMAACPGWETDAALLAAVPRSVQTGLHLTLTGEAPVTAMPRHAPRGRQPGIDTLTRRTIARRAALDEIAREVAAQFDRFIAATGRAPDFVDGHQHAHLLPGIRAIVLAETARRAPRAWVRNCADRPAAMAARPWRGKAIGSAVQSIGLARAAARHGLSCNSSFAGHYDFRADYAAVLPRFLARPGAVHLVMCHPGAGVLAGDTIAQARLGEAATLRAAPIADMAASHGLRYE